MLLFGKAREEGGKKELEALGSQPQRARRNQRTEMRAQQGRAYYFIDLYPPASSLMIRLNLSSRKRAALHSNTRKPHRPIRRRSVPEHHGLIYHHRWALLLCPHPLVGGPRGRRYMELPIPPFQVPHRSRDPRAERLQKKYLFDVVSRRRVVHPREVHVEVDCFIR